jgi:Mg2+ and Co2+ transporter CorA
VTVHRDPLPPLERQREQLDGRVLHSEQFLLYRVLDALVDSFFPILGDVDGEIDELEASVLANPTDQQLERLFSLKRQLVAMARPSPRSATCSPGPWTGSPSFPASCSTSATTSATSMTT